MHPYIPFAALPIAVTIAWFAASTWPATEHGRYRIAPVTQIEDPSVPLPSGAQAPVKTDIRVSAFLPRAPSRAPAPPPELILNSVMTGTDVYLASINSRLVGAGDKIEGYLGGALQADRPTHTM